MYFRELGIWQGYAMSSCCVGEVMSSKFRDCDFCLDESQVLNCVYFMFVVLSYEQGFYYVVLETRCMCQLLNNVVVFSF
ncbi:hypothetical protein Hanom_Chr05g00458281 [Helianthus anomalus]